MGDDVDCIFFYGQNALAFAIAINPTMRAMAQHCIDTFSRFFVKPHLLRGNRITGGHRVLRISQKKGSGEEHRGKPANAGTTALITAEAKRRIGRRAATCVPVACR